MQQKNCLHTNFKHPYSIQSLFSDYNVKNKETKKEKEKKKKNKAKIGPYLFFCNDWVRRIQNCDDLPLRKLHFDSVSIDRFRSTSRYTNNNNKKKWRLFGSKFWEMDPGSSFQWLNLSNSIKCNMPLLTWLNNCFYIVFIYRLHHYLKTVRNKRNLKKKKKNDNKVINFRQKPSTRWENSW